MQKILSVISLVLLLAFTASAQDSNAHAAVSAQVSGGLGYSNPSLGGVLGGDLCAGQWVISLDGGASQVRKTIGGAGYSLNARETVRYHFSKFFVQGGATQSYYSVTQFSKSTFAPLVGIGSEVRKGVLLGVNYRHDVTSENRNKILEGEITAYAKHRLFFRARIGVDWFRSGGQSLTGAATTIQVGGWFK